MRVLVVIVALLVIALLIWYIIHQIRKGYRQRLSHKREAKRIREKAVIARREQLALNAQIQHQLFLKGDAQGIYGQFTPEALPEEK